MAKQLQELRTTLSLDNDNFNQSAKQSQSELKSLRSEMSFVKSGGKEYANSLEGMGKQSDILNRTLQTQGRRLDAIKKKYDAAVKSSGEGSKEAQRLGAQYNNVASQMRKTERQLERVNGSLNEQRGKWNKVGREAQQAGKKMQSVGEGIQGVGESISTNVTAPLVGFGAIATETTREFREDLAKLEVNAKLAGVGMDVTKEAMRDLNAITGETDSNVEALSNLMATGMDNNQLKQAVDDLSGAVIRFPDTLKIEGLADGLQETLATGKAIGPFAELLERMGVNLEEFDEGLATAKDSGDELNYVLDKLNELDLSKVNDEFRKNNETLVEAREAQYDFQESLAELGNTIEPVATMVTNSLTDIMDGFNDLNPETQKTIIKFAGLAAVAGPATVAIGGITRGIGGLTKLSGSLTKTLGKAGGKGMIGRIGLMSAAGGPVGLAIGGIAALGLGIYALNNRSKEYSEISTEKIDAMKKEVESTDQLIERFNELKSQNRLSNDEMLRFLDIQAELQEASAPAVIQALTDEQGKLLEKSGLTNDEMNEFLSLNDKVIEKAPGTAKAISSEGEAYAENTAQLQKLNEEKRRELSRETRDKLLESMEQEKNLVQQKKDLQTEINNLASQEREQLNVIKETRQEYKENEQLVKDLKDQIASATGAEKRNLEGQLFVAENQLEQSGARLDMEKNTLSVLGNELTTKGKTLETVRQELQENDKLKYKYESLILSQAGINAEKGEGLSQIDAEIGKLETQKRQLDEKLRKGQINTSEYERQNGKIDTQLGKLRAAQGELEVINDLAGGTVYKDVIIRTPNLADFERRLSNPAYKTLNITTSGGGHYVEHQLAEGTDYHTGGLALVGEEGPELARHGNKWSMLDFGVADLPRGTQVFTNEETKRMMNALNRVPSYAEGISRTGEADRIINSLNGGGSQPKEAVINATFINELDGRELGRSTYRYVTEFQDREKVRGGRFQ